MSNPLLDNTVNAIIRFPEIQKQHIEDAVSHKISESEQLLKQICDIGDGSRNFENTVVAFDRLQGLSQKAGSVIYLLAYVHPQEDIRTVCRSAVDTLNQFSNRINLDEQLYQSFKTYSRTDEAKNLEGYKRKYLDERMDFYHRTGFALPESERAKLKEILNEISGLSLEFSSNINEFEDSLIVSGQEIQGLPEDYKKSHRLDDGNYKIGLDMPSYMPFMRYSQSEESRKKLMFKYLNRSPMNEPVLTRILTKRKEMADLLGYPSYADWQIEENMAHSTSTVFCFEENLREKIRDKAFRDYQALLQVKQEENPDAVSLNYWESSYYNNLLMKSRYGLDQEEMKQYFSSDNVIKGIFDICHRLYGVRFEKVENAPVWHSSVDMYQMFVNDRFAGFIYSDLYPRPGKYNHAACFTLLGGSNTDQGYQYPVAALVCNFPPATDDKPSLLPHGDVVTLFHEFGHLMHAMLAHSDLAGQSGISNVRDFVEVPSQMFENWAWNYEALSLFAFHYHTREVLPPELFDRMIAARNVGSGLHTQQQIFYGLLDMSYHTGFDPEGKEKLADVLKVLQNNVTSFPYMEDTHMYNSFGHLTGYAAGYYGYLWAKVYAEDIFSEFEKTGILNHQTGERFYRTILSKGSTVKEMDMVKDFLQRDPDQDAFMRSLGI